jgi:hypothetical protein
MGNHEGGDLCQREQFSDLFDNSISFSKALLLARSPRRTHTLFPDPLDPGICMTNIPHLVVHHSPDGYEFGYAGSGPADLALNVCQLYLNMTDYQGKQTDCHDGKCWTLAFLLHQQFKSQFIASAPKTGRLILFKEIDTWFKAVITKDLLEECSTRNDDEE